MPVSLLQGLSLSLTALFTQPSRLSRGTSPEAFISLLFFGSSICQIS